MKMKIQYFSLVVAIAIFTGCNSSSSSGSGSSSSISGRAIDGYINGATVCADINKNNICDPDEPSTKTDINGNFTLKGNLQGAPLLLTGGKDMGTGLDFDGQLTAPAGSKTITPLTTMVQTLVSNGTTETEATKNIKKSLGIPDNTDLKDYDPIAKIKADPTNNNAKKILVAQSKVQAIVDTVTDALNGVNNNKTKNLNSVLKSISSKLSNNKDIGDNSVIEDIYTTASNDSLSGDSEKTSKLSKLNNIKTKLGNSLKTIINSIDNNNSRTNVKDILNGINASLKYNKNTLAKKVKEAVNSGNDSGMPTNIDNGITEVENNLKFVEKPYDVAFTPIDVPLSENKEDTVQSTKSVTVNGNKEAINFNILRATGDKDNGQIFGQVKDYQDKPIKFPDGSPYICNGTNSGVGSGLDFSSILQKNNKLYMINQFECSVGAIYMSELEQNTSTGELTPKKDTLQFISEKDGFGGYTHCAGMVTPWQSHLSSEEYEPDAKVIQSGKANGYYDEVSKYYWDGDASKNSPYYYGWIPEIKISDDGKPDYSKHYSMGRFSHELAYVMPDNKTVYMTDDGSNTGIYMYIADTPKDLSAGTLYAANFTQVEKNRGGKFTLNWVDLGHATDSEIKTELETKPKFTDIFDEVALNKNNTCADGYTAIDTSGGAECLKVKSGMDKIASRFETRRYAAIKGATTELAKEEGIAFDPIHKKLYVAITSIYKGMTDNDKTYDKAGYNHIKLPENECGGVYALDLESGSNNSDYEAKNFYAILTGEAKDYSGTKYEGNSCDLDKISSPDNLSFIPNSNKLIIGEDTSYHKNNMIWTYNVETGKLDRIMTVPIGAEATSTDWYQDINGFSYQALVTQHPGVGTKQSSIGILGPITNLNKSVDLTQYTTPIAIKVPDYSVPGPGDVEGELPPCFSTGDNLVFKSNFGCKSLLPWSNYNTSGTHTWEASSHGNTYYAYISGYGDTKATDAWLITPKFNLTGNNVLTFKSAKDYDGSDMKLYVSEDYTGTGDPQKATWTEIKNVTWATEKKYVWTDSGNIDLSAYSGKNVYFAFRQIAQGTTSGKVANWEIKDVKVTGSGKVIIPFIAQISANKKAGDTITTLDTITFNANVSGGNAPYTYSWDFGDGDNSSKQNPTHKFSNAGKDTVKLTITDKDSKTATTNLELTIKSPIDVSVPTKKGDLRIATYNSYLNRPTYGELKKEIEAGGNAQIKNVAQIIQRVQPDILVLQEFDYYYNKSDYSDPTSQRTVVQEFIDDYLKVAQSDDTKAIDYPYFYTAPVNTGLHPDPAIDFNGDGKIDSDDAFGFGDFPGQYGMVVFSKYPINTADIKTFQKFLWKDMPDANIPKKADGTNYYTDEAWAIYRLSSKSHWDIPVTVNGKTIHVLTDHPTPPTFDDGDADGKDGKRVNNADNWIIDWNGKRNYDEIRIWSDYVDGKATYLYDDQNPSSKVANGGLTDKTRFVILGDHNSDPDEGDAYKASIKQLLLNNRINSSYTPTSKGAVDDGEDKDDTANWGLRADYVLPSLYGFEIEQGGVFWPQDTDVKHYLVEKTADGKGENSSDHRLTWLDLKITDTTASAPLLDENFETGSLGKMIAISVASNKNWTAGSYKSDKFARISGHGGDVASNDWLITPAITLTGKEVLNFRTASGNYGGPDLKVLISTDYDGKSADLSSATWTPLSATLSPANTSYKWTESGDIDLSAYTGKAYIAFQYTSTASKSNTWEVDDIIVKKKN